MPGWSSSDRRHELPANWASEVVPRIMTRDHRRCQHIREDTGRCCGRRATDVDHIDQTRRHDHSDGNLQALCQWHHRRKSGREGGIASGTARRTRAQATKPVHPGLLATAPDRTPPPF